MQSNASLAIGGGDAVGADQSHTQTSADDRRQRRQAQESEAKPAAGYRLAIQRDMVTGEWVYTVTDRDTGAVVARLSREAVARLGLKADYAAGALVQAKA